MSSPRSRRTSAGRFPGTVTRALSSPPRRRVARRAATGRAARPAHIYAPWPPSPLGAHLYERHVTLLGCLLPVTPRRNATDFPGSFPARLAIMTAAPAAEWREFDYENKAATAPEASNSTLVWVNEADQGVTLGIFDGFAFRLWYGTDDCDVTHWAPIAYPDAPAR